MDSIKRVLFLDRVHPALDEALIAMNYKCEYLDEMPKSSPESIIGDYYGVVIRSKLKLDKNFLSKATNLKFIARAGAGMENIDVEYAVSKGIACLKAPEGNKDAVADHATGMLLALLNHLHIADAEVRKGFWRREHNRGTELFEKTVGIIGYGFTGTEFARRLSGFNVTVLAHDKYKSGFSADNVIESSLDEIFEKADIISLHLPLNDETEYMFNDSFINKFTKNIYLVNTSRGKVVKTADLVKNIVSGKILGACLDVLEYESGSFEKLRGLSMWINKRGVFFKRIARWLIKIGLWKYLHPAQYLVRSDKVILSPHVAGWSFESNKRISTILADRIRELDK
ncbi:MAG: hypothetical protein COB85_00455 [Bacteroidetes bacterium]|nr:MAG: hypothetical protein COB85_00455 [Bacteroidota bacterium]